MITAESAQKQLSNEKEYLNIIAYTEMKRRGMTDKKIMLYYDIRPEALRKFKKQHNLIGK